MMNSDDKAWHKKQWEKQQKTKNFLEMSKEYDFTKYYWFLFNS